MLHLISLDAGPYGGVNIETIASKTHVASLIKRQPDIFNKYTFYEKESRAQAVLETYKEEYQKFYEVRPFIITPNP